MPTATLVGRSSIGALQKEAAIAIRELLDERTSTAEVVTIYVALKDEGTEVWRPVQAASLGGDLLRIVSANDDPGDEHWEFATGTIVRCKQQALSDGQSHLVAIEAVWIAAPRTAE